MRQSPTRRRWLRFSLRGLLILILIAALAGGYCLYLGISTSLHAERGLHAALLTVELLTDYVQQHEGQWPRSWSDLEDLPPREKVYKWPADSLVVQQYVTVDFSTDPQRLAKLNSAEFDAVRPIGPYYPFNDYGAVEALLTAIRENTPR